MEFDFESILNDALEHYDRDHGLSSSPSSSEEQEVEQNDEENINDYLDESEVEETQEEEGREEGQEEEREEEVSNQPDVIDDSRSRFSGASWFDKFNDLSITLAGLGGIGSWAAIHIARLNFDTVYLYDPDYVETANMSGQLFGCDDIGKDKTEVIVELMANYAQYWHTMEYTTRYTDQHCTSIFVCGFDNMEARKNAYKQWKKHWGDEKKMPAVFIDARLSAEQLQIFTITGGDKYIQDKYEKEWLFSDEEADSVVCSYKQTSFCAAIVGGLITNSLVNYIDNYYREVNLRNQPFMISYDATTMYLKTLD